MHDKLESTDQPDGGMDVALVKARIRIDHFEFAHKNQIEEQAPVEGED